MTDTNGTTGKIRLGFVNGDHLHFNDLLQHALACPTAEVVRAVIDDAELRAWFQEQYPNLRTFDDADAFYDAADVVEDAARRGVHVMKEKPMAASLAIAEGMATTAARHGVRLMVNWPNSWSPAIQHLKTLVDDGAIGKVWQIHHRAGHGGPPQGYLTGSPIGRVGWDWLIDRDRNGGARRLISASTARRSAAGSWASRARSPASAAATPRSSSRSRTTP